MALSEDLVESVAKLLGNRSSRPKRVTAVLSVVYSVELENGARVALAPAKPGSLETLRLAAAACGSRACRLCGKDTDDEFVQSTLDGSWFCATCVTEARSPLCEHLWSGQVGTVAEPLQVCLRCKAERPNAALTKEPG